MVKATVEGKKAARKVILGARNEAAKERCMEAYEEERERLKGVYIRTKRR